MAGSLAELCSLVMWKSELVNDGLGYFTDIFKQSVSGAALFLLAAYSKIKRKEVRELLTIKQKRTRTW